MKMKSSKIAMELNKWRVIMDNNFLEAFDNANKLQEGPINAFKTAVASHQVNKQNKANAEKQNANNVNDDLTNKNGYQQIIANLQKIANEQNQFDEKSIDKFIKDINSLKSLDDKSKRQINQMLNQQKTVLQQQKANQPQPEDAKTENPQDVSNETATDAKNPQQHPEQKGNAANVPEGNRNAIKVKLQGIAKELGQSEDDIIAYIKTL